MVDEISARVSRGEKIRSEWEEEAGDPQHEDEISQSQHLVGDMWPSEVNEHVVELVMDPVQYRPTKDESTRIAVGSTSQTQRHDEASSTCGPERTWVLRESTRG